MYASSNFPRRPGPHTSDRGPRVRPWWPRLLRSDAAVTGCGERGTHNAPPQDAAERCRIIGAGDADARRAHHRSRDGCRASCRSPPGPLIRGHASWPPSDHGRGGSRSAPAVLAARGRDLRRGVPGPTGPHHGHRPARFDRPRVDRAVRPRIARCRGPAAPAGLPAEREPARRRGATGARRRRAARPSSVGHRRRLRGHDRLPGRRPGRTMQIASRMHFSRSSCAPRATRVARRSRPQSPPIPRTSLASSEPGFATAGPTLWRSVAAAGAPASRI